MLDVHAPHERIHGFKDFLLHLLTITIGLLIALGLEGCVERVHQHHLRDEADRNLRQEILHNEHEVEATRAAIVTEKQNLIKVMQFLDARSKKQDFDLSDITIGFTSGTLSDASWRTATATGSLSFMEYDGFSNLRRRTKCRNCSPGLTKRHCTSF